jgi:hypothetical protein
LPRLTVSPLVAVVATAAFVCGAVLIAVAVWSRPITDGAAAARSGHLEQALERYAAAERRFDAIPITKRLLPTAYRATVANQLQVQYLLGKYDTVIEKAASSLSAAPVHFWAGCALFEKGRVAQKRDERVIWLNRAEEEFKKSLERQPADWDTKFNYELTRRLLIELREHRKPPPKQLLPLLRQLPRIPGVTDRRIG